MKFKNNTNSRSVSSIAIFTFFMCLVVLMISGCAEDEELRGGEYAPNIKAYKIENGSQDEYSDVRELFDVETISLDPSVSLKIGGFVDDFFVVDETLFVFNRLHGIVSALDFEGGLKWRLVAGSQDYEIFNSIGIVDYNPYKKQIEIYDNTSLSFYCYSLDGEFKNKEQCPVDFVDRSILGFDVVLYDIFQYPNDHIIEDGKRYKYLEFRNGTYTPKVEMHEDQEGVVFFEDYNTFNEIDGRIIHQANFYDTIFLAENDRMEAVGLVNFSQGGSSQKVMKDKRVAEKASRIFAEEIPNIDVAVLNSNRLYTTYYHGNRNYFSVVDESGATILNSNVLFDGDMVFRTPQKYWNGYFLSRMPTVDQAIQDKLVQNNILETDYLWQGLSEIRAQENDVQGEVIHLLRMK